MPMWAWIVVAVGAVLVLALAAWLASSRKRTGRLRDRFGPEYERAVEREGSSRKAEAELAGREERRDRLEIRPLAPPARDRYLTTWQSLQAQFVDSPEAATVRADRLIQSVMADRGYPVEDFDQRAADISVDHPHVVEHYRKGHRLARQAGDDGGSTEDLRQAMRHYRALFEELLEADRHAYAEAESNVRPQRPELTTTRGDR